MAGLITFGITFALITIFVISIFVYIRDDNRDLDLGFFLGVISTLCLIMTILIFDKILF
jgi:hypothetical protein